MADEIEPAVAAAVASPGKWEKPKRNYRTLNEKVGLCIECEKRVYAEKSLSFRAFCREHDVDPAQMRRWQKNLVQMKNAMDATTKKKTKFICTMGRKSVLDKSKDKLLPWIYEKQKGGKTLSVRQ